MFQDYTDRVLKKYTTDRDSGKLSTRLSQPKPATIRDECLDRFIAGVQKKDENTLKVFFRHTGNFESIGTSIEQFGLGKFKSLIKFLNGRIPRPSPRNVELVAWLVNFEPRPFELGKNYDADGKKSETGLESLGVYGRDEDGKVIEVGDDSSGLSTMGKKTTGPKSVITNPKWKKFALATAFLASIGFGGYKLINNKTGAITERCMYWKVERYEAISCNDSTKSTLVIALNQEKLRNFRKIMKPDTITYHSIGKVWYLKKNKQYEFFTGPGNHPQFIDKELHPITPYIIDSVIKRRL